MSIKKECIAMLLAGGQGSRLFVLTKKLAKPAVPFGGKYRIIDFTLSNCINSGIDTVGILTQYQPLKLNTYIGSGQPWDLDRVNGGAYILPPFQRQEGADWYKGTANAIYQNMDFIEEYEPEYVLILSGDHIYKMDYYAMLEQHKREKADCTISVLKVPMEEASRFGIMKTDQDNVVIEFEEKPENPKSDMASMGVYIFTWKKLKKYLELDELTVGSANDFGKNIIPDMLSDDQRLMTFEFKGYWKDVGTIESLWEANMDLLNPDSGFKIDDPNMRIYSRNPSYSPHFIGSGAKVSNAIIAEGCEIYGTVENSIISLGVTVEKGAIIKDSIIMHNTIIKEGATIHRAIIGEETTIGAYSFVGEAGENKPIAVVGYDAMIEDDSRIKAGSIVD